MARLSRVKVEAATESAVMAISRSRANGDDVDASMADAPEVSHHQGDEMVRFSCCF